MIAVHYKTRRKFERNIQVPKMVTIGVMAFSGYG